MHQFQAAHSRSTIQLFVGVRLRLNRSRFVAVRSGTFDCLGVLGFCNRVLRSFQLAFSRTTSVGLLSSRIPRNTGCRNRSSRVHSVNLTWQTIVGFTQWQRLRSVGVRP